MTNVDGLAELIIALDESEVGVNVIIFNAEEKEKEKEENHEKEDWWNDIDIEGIFGGMGGGSDSGSESHIPFAVTEPSFSV